MKIKIKRDSGEIQKEDENIVRDSESRQNDKKGIARDKGEKKTE